MTGDTQRGAVAGAIAMVLGVAGASFGLFALAMSGVMSLSLLLPAQPGDELELARFHTVMWALLRVWWLHMPIWMLGGIGLVWTGNRLRRGQWESAPRVRLLAALAIAELAAYTAHVYLGVLPIWLANAPPSGFEPLGQIIVPAGGLVPVVHSVPFVWLIWALRRR